MLSFDILEENLTSKLVAENDVTTANLGHYPRAFEACRNKKPATRQRTQNERNPFCGFSRRTESGAFAMARCFADDSVWYTYHLDFWLYGVLTCVLVVLFCYYMFGVS
ncbi:hypothetical protein EVAR_8564_1 [Eumeta japonica]|uniref:Uncharacterized protein n=1 Tax=Eumeta variegata TaxID=151549 RepID=A0A4C1TXJ9_EUMVA|nr:hypothetical protein EVAR_8564_1 [Eumeta japonica]